MTKSMTGFGRAEINTGSRNITTEIKSVNHRYFEFSCRTTRGYSFLEEKLKKYVNERIARGKVDMFVSLTEPEDTEVQVTLNKPLLNGYLNALKEISDMGVNDDISVSTVSRYSDIFQIHKPALDEEIIFNEVKEAVDIALDSFIKMREDEGKKLEEDILSRGEKILSLVEIVEKRSPETVKEYQDRLYQKVKEVVESANIDEQRILTEVAIFADKVAVAEETVRLRSHIEQMNTFFKSEMPIGRKLDFLVQEMNREANTIGSKVTDSELAHVVVDIKSEIEKIREQIQNIE